MATSKTRNLVADEVATLSQFTGVPEYLAVTLWKQGLLGRGVEEVYGNLTELATEYQNTNDWSTAASNIFPTWDASEVPDLGRANLRHPVFSSPAGNMPDITSDYGLPPEREPEQAGRTSNIPNMPNIITDEGPLNTFNYPAPKMAPEDYIGPYQGNPDTPQMDPDQMEEYMGLGSNRPTPDFNQFNAQLNRMGSQHYDMDRYIRKMVEEEFNNA